MLYIASDHGGYSLKEEMKKFLDKQNVPFKDLGPFKLDLNDDYPDYAKLVAAKISANPKNDLGLLMCRSGQGVNIVANKFKKVRAALVWNTAEAKASRTDDLANIVSLPTDYITSAQAKQIITVWLQTELGTEPRHLRRVKKISAIE